MSGLFSAPAAAAPAAPKTEIAWTPASATRDPNALGFQNPLTRTSSGASLGASPALVPGSAYKNTVLGEA